MKKQVVVVHGGRAFKTYKQYMSFFRLLKVDLDRYKKRGWKDSLQEKLGRNFEVFLLKMPNPANAKYDEWKILFKKISSLLNNSVVLIGHSLGAIFLAKYLSENKFPKKILATLLVSPPYDEEGMDESLGGFVLTKSLDKLNKQGGRIFIYQSKDDLVVPYSHLGKYKKGAA